MSESVTLSQTKTEVHQSTLQKFNISKKPQTSNGGENEHIKVVVETAEDEFNNGNHNRYANQTNENFKNKLNEALPKILEDDQVRFRES